MRIPSSIDIGRAWTVVVRAYTPSTSLSLPRRRTVEASPMGTRCSRLTMATTLRVSDLRRPRSGQAAGLTPSSGRKSLVPRRLELQYQRSSPSPAEGITVPGRRLPRAEPRGDPGREHALSHVRVVRTWEPTAAGTWPFPRRRDAATLRRNRPEGHSTCRSSRI